MVEIKGLLNSQPLTYVEDYIEESLTPTYLYCGHRVLNSIEKEGYESDPGFNSNREKHFQESTNWYKYSNPSRSVG